ncbi:MAG: metallophosphoesterase [Spirochaetes bacterium]|nr:metallophosphoesterase [Spirochaetota bacterium]
MKADESLGILQALYQASPRLDLDRLGPVVIMSDLHLGNGKRGDDFRQNAEMVLYSLRYYLKRGFTLVLNGDIEDLYRFEERDIRRTWPEFYRILDSFHNAGKLCKIVGNHDLELTYTGAGAPAYPLGESLRLSHAHGEIFIFHGHQMSRYDREYNAVAAFVLRYLATPLGIKNITVAQSSTKRFFVEKHVYAFAQQERILSIIGHTHRPLFESMSKIDSLRFEIELLCRQYPKMAEAKRRKTAVRIAAIKQEMNEAVARRKQRGESVASLYHENLLVPCLFNPGSPIGKRGCTCLELDAERIGLVTWQRTDGTRKWRSRLPGKKRKIGGGDGTPFLRHVIKEESLSYIFSRIALLGG